MKSISQHPPSHTKSISTVISINPNDLFYYFRWFSFFFILSILFLILSLSFLILYITSVKEIKTPTIDKTETILLQYPSIQFLYSSISLSILSLLMGITCTFKYISIFSFRFTWISGSLYSILLISILIISLSIRYLSNACVDSNTFFDTHLQTCVPRCSAGELYNDKTATCQLGCFSKETCPSDNECVSGQCCNTTVNTIINDQCCPNANVHQTESGQKICCPMSSVCGETCCLLESICDDKTNQCKVQCGEQYCSPNQVCITYDPCTFDSSIPCGKSKTSTCINKDTNCKAQTNTIKYFPPAVSNFYPAYDASHNSKDTYTKDINTYLNTPFEQINVDLLSRFQETDKDGYLCGLETPIRFESIQYTGDQCTLQNYLQDIPPYQTLSATIVSPTDDSNYTTINMILDPSKQDLPSQYDITSIQTNNGLSTPLTQTFTYGGKTSTPLTQLASDSSTCNSGKTFSNEYQSSCSSFSPCTDMNQCPFTMKSEDSYECKYSDTKEKGWISSIIPPNSFCVRRYLIEAFKYEAPLLDTQLPVWKIIKADDQASTDFIQWDDDFYLKYNSAIDPNNKEKSNDYYEHYMTCKNGQSFAPTMQSSTDQAKWKLKPLPTSSYDYERNTNEDSYILNGDPVFIYNAESDNHYLSAEPDNKSHSPSMNNSPTNPSIPNAIQEWWCLIQQNAIVGQKLRFNDDKIFILKMDVGSYEALFPGVPLIAYSGGKVPDCSTNNTFYSKMNLYRQCLELNDIPSECTNLYKDSPCDLVGSNCQNMFLTNDTCSDSNYSPYYEPIIPQSYNLSGSGNWYCCHNTLFQKNIDRYQLNLTGDKYGIGQYSPSAEEGVCQWVGQNTQTSFQIKNVDHWKEPSPK